MKRHHLVFWVPAYLVLAADLYSKHFAVACLSPDVDYPLLGPWLGLHLTARPNTGGVFGLLPSKGYVFVILTVVALLVVWWMLRSARPERLLFRLSLGLITGGALGNLADRALIGGVRDFIKLRYWPWAFNLADAAICAAAGLLILEIFREGRAEARKAHGAGKKGQEAVGSRQGAGGRRPLAGR